MAHPKVFVSYAGEDADLAQQISAALRGQGIDAFFAGWEIAFGDDLVKKLNEGLSQASFFVLLVSKRFLEKDWPLAEQSAATVRMVEEGTRVIPVNLGIPNEAFPPLIRALRWVPGEGRDATAIATDIAATVYGTSSKPPVGSLPKFVDHSLDLASFPSLTAADKAILRMAFEIGAEELFLAGFEDLEARAQEAGIDSSTMNDSLEVLEESYLLKLERVFGGINSVVLTTSGAEECCSELVPNYAKRKREILAAIVNSPDSRGTNSDELAERTGEPQWLVCHVLRDAELRTYVTIRFVGVGHEFYSIGSISPKLKRKLQEHEAE